MDRLYTLYDQIRTAWDTNRDVAVAYHLAEDHPDLADDIRDYARVLVRLALDEHAPDPEGDAALASAAAAWLSEQYPTDPSASSAGGASRSADAATPPTPLRLITSCSGKKAADAAREMGVTVLFISAVSRHARSIPTRWHSELARRAHNAFGIPTDQAENSFRHGLDAGRLAASRGGAFGPPPSPEQILDQGGITDPADRAPWLSLVDDA